MADATTLASELWKRRSAEEQLLFCFSRAQLTDAWRQPALDIVRRSPVAWERVLEIAVLHQVTPLIYRNLQASPEIVTELPQSVLERLRQSVVLNIQRKQKLQVALEKALEFFNGYRIDVLLVKGTALDQRLGAEPWWTVSQDVDLFLSGRWHDHPQEVIAHLVALNQQKPPVDVQCEKHSDLDMNRLLPIDFESILATARPTTVGEHRALMMAIEDELVCTCIQSFRKRYFRLKSLHDLTALIELYGELSWEVVARRAREWRCSWMVYTALRAAEAAVGCPVPVDLRQRLAVPWLRVKVLDDLIARMSFSSLETLYDDRTVRGKRLGKGLWLQYASQPLGQLWRSLRIVSKQMATQRPTPSPH
jgi:hypothetical protein